MTEPVTGAGRALLEGEWPEPFLYDAERHGKADLAKRIRKVETEAAAGVEARVRAIHIETLDARRTRPDTHTITDYGCTEDGQPWPCATIAALEGDTDD